MNACRNGRFIRLALVGVVVLAGCSGGEDTQTSVAVPCSIAIDVLDDLDDTRPYRAIGSGGGFVALPSRNLAPTRTGSAGTEFEGFRFAKFGLLVRRDRVVSLEVVNSPDEAVLEYTHPDTPARVVSVGPCSSEHGEWIVFAGGLWVTEPGCVELLVASGEERVGVPLPVGAPCDGAP